MSCSINTVRRLEAGEPVEAEAAAHVASCERCAKTRRELAQDRAKLLADVPFDAFAAGIAERLAQPARRPRSLVRVLAPVAMAASIALVATVALKQPGESVRTKGGASVQLFVREGGPVRLLASGAKIPQGALILPALVSPGRPHAKVLLVEPSETSVLYDGPANAGPLPQSFDWTGTKATLRVVLSGGQGPDEVLEVPLLR